MYTYLYVHKIEYFPSNIKFEVYFGVKDQQLADEANVKKENSLVLECGNERFGMRLNAERKNRFIFSMHSISPYYTYQNLAGFKMLTQ